MDQRTIYVAGLFLATGMYSLRRGIPVEKWFNIMKKCLESEVENHEEIIKLMQKMFEDAGEVAFIAEVIGLKGFPEASSVVSGAKDRLKQIIAGEEDELH